MDELSKLKLSWEALNHHLEKTEILNTRIVKEIISTRSKTTLNRLLAREIYLLCVGFVIGVLFFILRNELGLEGKSIFILFAASFITIVWAGVKIVMLNRLRIDRKSVHDIMVLINKYKLNLRWERPLATTVGVVLMVMQLYLFDISYTTSFYLFYGAVIVLAYIFTYLHYLKFDKKNIEKLEKTLKELEDLE